MKIVERKVRECCQEDDLIPYFGKAAKWIKETIHRPKFCKHCGQIWIIDKEMGPAGSMEPVLKALVAGSDD